ncbi:SRPBCC family protein [Halorubellus sp. JP-L1]|uniref:SRPBCC family protein n=1 Tax=Halorubellus sp. JP-L1 TaxID=2715753 RepID=UPI0014084F59|nr:SRPBCC family protein [Halorubellus sp. JP-L1]NHN40094.1 SRPBCC family protein [Halorubellus sp. JP-L1]
MPTFQRDVRVHAPFETVWDFHSDVAGLEALTPEFMRLEVVSVRGPDGEPEPDVLETGAEIDMRMHPLGVTPALSWTSVIVEREETDGSAYFVDEMRDGPFREWRHAHMFYADDGDTIVRDRVDYRLPFGALGDAVGPFAKLGFEGMFRDRHGRTKRLLE